jgi:hypothetical protein
VGRVVKRKQHPEYQRVVKRIYLGHYHLEKWSGQNMATIRVVDHESAHEEYEPW